jgi:hypothetical protein
MQKIEQYEKEEKMMKEIKEVKVEKNDKYSKLVKELINDTPENKLETNMIINPIKEKLQMFEKAAKPISNKDLQQIDNGSEIPYEQGTFNKGKINSALKSIEDNLEQDKKRKISLKVKNENPQIIMEKVEKIINKKGYQDILNEDKIKVNEDIRVAKDNKKNDSRELPLAKQNQENIPKKNSPDKNNIPKPEKKYIEIKLEDSNFNQTNTTNNLTNNKNIPAFLNDIPPPTFFNKVQTPSNAPPSTKSKNISLDFSYQKIAPPSSEFSLLSSNNDDNLFDSVLDMVQKKNRKNTKKEEGKFHKVSKSEFMNLEKNMIDKTPEISISISKSNKLDSIKEESSDNTSKNKANKSSNQVNIQKNSRNNLSVQYDNYNESLFFNTSNQFKQKDRMDRSMNESKRSIKQLKNKSTSSPKKIIIDPKVTDLNKE